MKEFILWKTDGENEAKIFDYFQLSLSLNVAISTGLIERLLILDVWRYTW